MKKLSLLLLFVLFIYWGHCKEPYDPDVKNNFTQIIETKGYPCETHEVTTEDGYILTVFRIPYGINNTAQPRPPVLLQHGLLDSSFTWIVNEPWESLSYILADSGFDVWMGNSRGNLYSLKHVNLSTDSKEFWQFSWDQMAEYDFPAMVNYIQNVTSYPTIGYVGHSQGTLEVFAGLSRNPSFASNLNTFVGFGPIVKVGHITNEFLLELSEHDTQYLFEAFGFKQFLPANKYAEKYLPPFCQDFPDSCDLVIEWICGKHYGAFNNSRMQVVAGHEPGGTSVQNVAHFSQNIKKDNFVMYDYNTEEENRQHYGQSTPPAYNFSNFPSDKLPTSLFYGSHDELADPQDVAWLIANIPTLPYYAEELDKYAHLDYVWDYKNYETFYPKVVAILTTFAHNMTRA